MNTLPATVSPIVFLLTLPFLLAFVSFGKRTSDRLRKGRKERGWVWGLATVGSLFVLGMLVLAFPIVSARSHLFVLAFSWFCAHGWPAVLVAKMTIGLLREYRSHAKRI